MSTKKAKKSSGKRSNTDELDKTKKYKMKKKHKMNPKTKKVLKIFFILLLLLCIIGAGIFAGLFFGLFGDDFKITKEDLELTKISSVVKDEDGNVIASLAGDENRQIISMSEMPTYLPKAFVSIEDERFYKHHGVDILRTGKATLSYVIHLGKGSSSGGGSTITQQLVKNLTKEKDSSGLKGIVRKVKEMAKARQVEKMISKDQVLELYLNVIFLGDQNYGVEIASQYYFSKPAKDLDLAQCAFLAGITHSPNRYNPFNEEKKEETTELIKKRTKTVLAKMKELGAITDEEEYNAAVAEVENGLAFTKGQVSSSVENYSYHTAAAINQAKKDLMEQNGWNEKLADINIRTKGYTIYTTQKTSIQTRMEEEFKKDKYVLKGREKNKDGTLKNDHTQAAMVMIDHTTGKVVGTVGGLGTDVNASGLNRAVQSIRSPGSSIKPIAIIAPGLEKNVLTAGTVYDDCDTYFNNGKYHPKNEYKAFKGPLTVREAIKYSSNIPHVKMMTEVTPEASAKFLREMGVTSITKNEEGLSLALGGISGISPLEMAAAYAAIANDGEYITPIFYTKVEDRQGKTVVQPKQEKRRVMSVQNAYVEKNILTEPVKGSGGTATYCNISGMDVAAKTGTSNDNYDRWLCGFTPYYTAATWYGYDTQEEVKYGDGNPSGRIWSAIMKDIHKDLEKKKFEKPSGITTATICKDTGLLASESCSRTYTEVFTAGTVPKERCQGQVTVKICKETGKIANEYCLDTEEKTYTIKPPKEQKGKWDSKYGDKYGDPPTETCIVHTKPKEEEPPVNNTTSSGGDSGGNTTPPENNTIGNNNTVDGNNTAGGNSTNTNESGNNTVED